MPHVTFPALTRRRAFALCALAVTALVVGTGLITAAALAHAPIAALPVVILAGIAMPMLMAYELPVAIASIRDHAHAVAALRRHLDGLPETAHPLGL